MATINKDKIIEFKKVVPERPVMPSSFKEQSKNSWPVHPGLIVLYILIFGAIAFLLSLL